MLFYVIFLLLYYFFRGNVREGRGRHLAVVETPLYNMNLLSRGGLQHADLKDEGENLAAMGGMPWKNQIYVIKTCLVINITLPNSSA